MIAKFAFAALCVASLGACVAPPLEHVGAGASPANFSYKSDAANARAVLAAAETGKASVWKVSERSHGAAAPAGAVYADRVRRACQPLKLERDDQTRQVTACKGADGTWVVAEWSPDKGE